MHIQNYRHIQSVSGTLFRYYSRSIHVYARNISCIFRHIHKITFLVTRIKEYQEYKPNTCPSGQVLLLNHSSNLFVTFLQFFFKSRHSTFCSSGQYFNNNNNNNNNYTNSHSCQRHQDVIHTNIPATLPMLHTLACHPCQHVSHVNHASKLPLQAR